jgi:glutamate synthase (NADPH/NADH) small chain
VSDPTGFLKYKRQLPDRRPPADRVRDWREFYAPLAEPKLQEQAARCMDCGVPFCQSQTGCPVENRIPDWNDLVHQGRWREASASLHATNNFPEFTGKLCPAPCESACVLGLGDDPVAIRVIESSIVDRAFAEGWVDPEAPARKSGRSVAIVGSGPAGLAAAQQLARSGHAVTVFEKADRVGGLLRFGIPDFKLEKSVLDRRLAQLTAEGVTFQTGTEIGRDISIDSLQARFDAVCLAVGAERPRDVRIPGRDLAGIHFAMDYLTQQNRRVADLESQGESISAQGRRVVVLGGGDTGSDCVGTAHRQGAREVRQFEILAQPPAERHASTPWPEWPLQLRTSHAHEEGGERRWEVRTAEFLGTPEGRVRGLRLEDETEIEADLVIIAAGFVGLASAEVWKSTGLELNARNGLRIDARFQTSRAGVFAAGDAQRGASLIVWAIAEGRKMASSVELYLSDNKGKKPGSV